MRDDSVISLEQMYELEQIIAENGGGIIIYCTGDPEAMWERCTSRGEDYITDYKDLLAIHNAYETLFNKVEHILPVMRYEI